MQQATLPHPVPTALSQPFWDGCQRRQITLQRCDRCGRFRFYPCEACPYCRSRDCTWTDVDARGTVYSWIIVRRSVDAVWQARAPYIAGIIELDVQKGLLIPAIVIDCPVDSVRAGMPVEVTFEQTDASTVVPRWRPVS
ncbi:MAG TPA: OB-fold domain-containing protein [Vineibacter sp.]|nr:OB-fold domain-containing protein [Vineibacter sp.]